MLGESQLTEKEPLTSPFFFFFLNKEKGLGASLCPSGLNAQIVCLDQFSIFLFQTFRSSW